MPDQALQHADLLAQRAKHKPSRGLAAQAEVFRKDQLRLKLVRASAGDAQKVQMAARFASQG